MPPEPGNNGEPANLGVELMKDLVKNLVILNENMDVNRTVMLEVRDLLDELNGNFDVLTRAMSILDDVRSGGKKQITLADFAAAYVSADEEVHDDEDEPDGGDPRVPAGAG